MIQADDDSFVVSECEDLQLPEVPAERSYLRVERYVRLQIPSEMQQSGIPRQLEVGTAHLLVAHDQKHRSIAMTQDVSHIPHIPRNGGLLFRPLAAICFQ